MDGKEFVVDVYDKKKETFFSTSISRICAEKHLYTLEENSTLSDDVLAIEKEYARWIEPLYLKSYKILTNNNISHLLEGQKESVLFGVFQLYLRNPKHLRETLEFHSQEIRKIHETKISKNEKTLIYLDQKFDLQEFSCEKIQEEIAYKLKNSFKEEHLIGTNAIVNFHKNAILEVSVIKDNSQFITSDNPLISEDKINSEINPLLKSKEFAVPLDRNFLLRIYHDKTKNPYLIYRLKLPNGSVASANHSTFKDSSRFIIGEKSTIENFLEVKKNILDSTSLELKMGSLRQLLELKSFNNKKARELVEYFLKLYELNGTLTKEQEYILYKNLNELGKQTKKGKIS
tara:strand:- start:2255 stop:3289 length:1035 start_codon:yes stop_codon:yes gene_type:complete